MKLRTSLKSRLCQSIELDCFLRPVGYDGVGNLRRGNRPMSRDRRILLNTTLSLALGTTACMGHHPLFGCGLSLDPAHCNLVQGPVSIGNAADPGDTVPDI